MFTSDISPVEFLTFQRGFCMLRVGSKCSMLVTYAPVNNMGKLLNFSKPQFLILLSANDSL